MDVGKGYVRIGTVTAMIGLIVTYIASYMVPASSMSSIYAPDFIGAISIAIIGVGLFLIGAVFVIVGIARDD
jgi:uncharacterized membrane protein